MTTKELIRAEIERQMKYYDEKEQKAWDDSDALWYQGHQKMCAKLLSFLDTLPDEPVSNDLKEAAEKSAVQYYVDGGYSPFQNIETASHIAGFKAGAKWMKKQMPMPEDTVLFQKGVEEGKRLMMEGAVVAHVSIDELSCGLYNLCVEAGMTSETDATIIILPKEGEQ